MKKLILILCLVILTGFYSSAQYKMDYGVLVGAANYLGEIGGSDKEARALFLDLKAKTTRPALGGFFRYNINHHFAAKAQLTWLRISGADSNTILASRRTRNLSFRNDIIDFSLLGNYFFYTSNDVGRAGRYKTSMQAYLFTGFNVFYSNPKAQYEGSWYALQPLQTENTQYSNLQIGIPAGIGLFYTFQRKYRVGLEFSYVSTFTDFLDDVSDRYGDPSKMPDPVLGEALSNRNTYLENAQELEEQGIYESNYGWNDEAERGSIRGNPKNNDGYFLGTVSFSWAIRGKSTFYKSRFNFNRKHAGARRSSRAKF